MPTKPIKKLLNRHLSRAAACEFVEIACPLLRECVNNGTWVFMRCWDSSSVAPNENAAPLVLYLHIIEFVDAIEELLRNSCMVPSIALLRSCFEALLQLEYILEDDGCYTTRSLAWLKKFADNRVAYYEYVDPETERGRTVRKSIAEDKATKALGLPTAQRARKRARAWRGLLSDAEAAKCASLPSREELSKRLKRHAQYTFLYRKWSSIVHAQDLSHVIAVDSQGHSGVRRLRDPREAQEVALFAACYIVNATGAMLRKFRPGEEKAFADWFTKEVKDPLDKLWNLDIEFV